jgi:hypothetical protein
MSTLSVSSITGVTSLSGGAFDAVSTTANNANAQSIASFGQANAAFTQANAAFNQANNSQPTGTIITQVWRNGDAVPNGYLRMDGNVYTRSSYFALANLIGAPIEIGNYTTLYRNTGLLLSDVYLANGVLFHNGTSRANNANTTTPNSLIYSTDSGLNWNFVSAQGVTAQQEYGQRENHSGLLSLTSRVAASPNGIYVITNAQANGVNYYTAENGEVSRTGNAFMMISNTGLGTWAKVVVTGGTGFFKDDLGSNIRAVAYGGTQNRFVALFNAGGVGGSCGDADTFYNHKIGWSNNGSTWAWQTSNASIGTSSGGGLTVNPVFRRFSYFLDVAGSSNGFVAITTNSPSSPNANSVFTSADGIVWSDISSNVYFSANGVTGTTTKAVSFANGFFIISDSTTGAIMYSSDRLNWSKANVSVTQFGTSAKKIQHNGKVYYHRGTTDSQLIHFTSFNDTLNVQTISLGTSEDNFNIIVSCNIGNNIFGHGYANSTTDGTARMGIYSMNHTVYTEATQFPLPNGSTTMTMVNPTLPRASFIKT